MGNFRFRNLLSSSGILVFLTAIFSIVFIIIVLSSFLRQNETPTDTPIPTPTPYQTLTDNEDKFPQATPQPFRNAEEEATGTLVVTSAIEDVTVLLDASSHPDPEDPIPDGQKWPQNTTPFTVEDIPVGEHVLFAIKPPEYDMTTVSFVIRENEVTRINIELTPLRTSN